MSLSAAAMRILAEKGLSIDDIIAVAEANDVAPAPVETPEERRRRLDRERKQRVRSAEKADISADKADTACPQMSAVSRGMSADKADIVTPLARVRDNPSRLVISGQTDDDDCASAQDHLDDWPKANLIAALVEEVASPRLDHRKSPGLVQTSGQLAAWKRDGASWEHDVLPVVKALCAKSRTPIASWKFFAPAIAQSIADNRAALAIPEARQATGPPVVSITDRIAAENAEVRRRTDEILAQRAARNG